MRSVHRRAAVLNERSVKTRLDQLLVQRGLAESRARAQALIAAGAVSLDGKPATKAGKLVDAIAEIAIAAEVNPWVSRSAVKLAHGLDHFGIDPTGRVALDIGASTGGFSQVLLARGASRVYAVDVGHDQLAACLREDPRIVSLEKTNARYLSRDQIPEPVGVVVCDVSFIGLETVLPAPLSLAAPGALLVSLIKPQFEVGPGQVGSGGIVRDAVARRRVCDRLSTWLASLPGWRFLGLCESPIQGSDGNHEFLLAGCYR